MSKLNLVLFIACLPLFACAQEQKVQATNSSSDGSVTRLTLSWTPVTTMNSYHIYYVNPQKKVFEIDSVHKDEDQANFNKGTLKIDGNNMEAWPSSGEQACFYVVAESNGVKSNPSSKACIVL